MAVALHAWIGKDTLELDDCIRRRIIAKTGTETPLLVPSFSSVAFSDSAEVRSALGELRPFITLSSLVSAFDIHSGFVSREIDQSDIVFVDSGNYERGYLEGLKLPVDWTRAKFEATIDSIVPLTQLAVVNFDQPGPLVDQVKSASAFFEKHPRFIRDFLYKPRSEGHSYVDISELIRNIDLVGAFDIIGVTEKELGPSLLEKCSNLVRLRRSLNLAGKSTPVHVYGCFEPINVILMTICGADIFDGLTWSKYVMSGSLVVYKGLVPFLSKRWALDDAALIKASATEYLRQMNELMFKLRSFVQNHDYNWLGLPEETLRGIKDFALQVDAGAK